MLLRFSQIDPAFTARFIIHANSSPYTVPDADLHERSLKYLRDGQFFTCYLGTRPRRASGRASCDFSIATIGVTVAIPNGPGIFFTCGCYACQISGADGEGYALAAARNPKGPVAVIGSHGESYSVAGLLALDGVLGCWHGGKPPERLADYWMAVQTGLARGSVDSFTFFALDQVDGSHGKSSLDEQRREHLEMWTLLGDPALRMPTPAAPIQLESSAAVTPGKEISVSGVSTTLDQFRYRAANAGASVGLCPNRNCFGSQRSAAIGEASSARITNGRTIWCWMRKPSKPAAATSPPRSKLPRKFRGAS